MKTMALDYIRQALEQTLEIEHNKNADYFGGRNQIAIMSFYEQMNEQYEVDRFTEVYQDLVNEQNKSNLIGNGVLVAPENPSYINVNTSIVVPLTWTLQIRTTLGNRDQMVKTLNHLNDLLRGRKQDIAELNNGKLFMVGSPFNIVGVPKISKGDFLGIVDGVVYPTLQDLALAIKNYVVTQNGGEWFNNGDYFYYEENGIIKVGHYLVVEGVETYAQAIDDSEIDILIPPTHTSFTKYKVSISFDAIRIDEPRVLNSEEYCTITIGGSGTVVNASVFLGNDISMVSIQKYRINAKPIINLSSTSVYYLEPLEIPSGLGIANEISQLTSNNFLQNRHNSGINPQINYSFILDKRIDLLKQFYKYARYGIVAKNSSEYVSGISPNMIFKIKEYTCSWGEYEINEFYAKASDNIDIDNTESDTITLALQFEIQALEN